MIDDDAVFEQVCALEHGREEVGDGGGGGGCISEVVVVVVVVVVIFNLSYPADVAVMIDDDAMFEQVFVSGNGRGGGRDGGKEGCEVAVMVVVVIMMAVVVVVMVSLSYPADVAED